MGMERIHYTGWDWRGCLAALEEQYSHLAEVEVDEVARLVCHVRPKVAAHYAMPGWVVFFVKFFFNVRCNVLESNKIYSMNSQPAFNYSF